MEMSLARKIATGAVEVVVNSPDRLYETLQPGLSVGVDAEGWFVAHNGVTREGYTKAGVIESLAEIIAALPQ